MNAMQVMAVATKAVWIWFLVGWFMHLLMRADLSAVSSLNGIQSRVQFFSVHVKPTMVSLFLSVLMFGMLIQRPDFVSAAARRVLGIDLGMSIPIAWWSAGLIGFFITALIDWLAARLNLQKEVPPLHTP